MLQPKSQPSQLAPASVRAARPVAQRPFFGALNAVLVDNRGVFDFDGAVREGEAAAVWAWFVRDLAADLIDPDVTGDSPGSLAALEALAPTLLTRARAAITTAAGNPEAERRLRSQLGGTDALQRLPIVLNAIKCMPLLPKAQAFGRAVNGLGDDEAQAALQAMPRQDTAAAPLLMVAAVGEILVPERLIVPATRIAGGATETALQRAGFGPLVDALLAHAQNAIPPLLQRGAFADIDLACRSVERFHRLIRGFAANVEMARQGRWSTTIASLTKTVSDQLEPRLRHVTPDINQGLRRAREGADRLDSDSLLSALNGLYLLAVVRDCRDSLALNEVFDESWLLTGQTLELHLNRNLDALRQNPADQVTAARLDSGIKMADVRFGAEYADVLRRARDGVERRLGSG